MGRVNLLELTLAPSFNICDTPGAFGTCNAMFAVKITLIQYSFKVKTNVLKFGHKIVRKFRSTTNTDKLSHGDTAVPAMILCNRILNYTIRYKMYVHLWITEYFSRSATVVLTIGTYTSFRIKESLVFPFFIGYCTFFCNL